MKRLTYYLAIICLNCYPSMQAYSGNSNLPPVISIPKAEAWHPQTRTAEIVLEEITQIERSIETELSTETKQAIETNKTSNKAEAPQRYIAVKTNLAYRAIAVNNLAIEVACSKHLSIELPLMWSLWDVNKNHSLSTFTVQPEVRWWATETGQGHFFGVHTHVGWFNAKWNNDRYQDTGRPLLGAGLSYGYSLPFSRHWGAEFTLGAGYANMKYDTYYNIDNGALISTGDRKNYWGITRIGLSLVYRF